MISNIPKWVSSLFGKAMKPNIKILETSYISSQIKKIRFQGDISKWNFQIGYASVLRVSETEFRNYTIANYDREAGFFDIIFHIHGKGVGSKYVDTLQMNDELFISPPRGKILYDSSIMQQFFFGDETSFGIACSLLPLLKKNKHKYHFCFELDENNKEVPEVIGLENYSVFPKNGLFRNENLINSLSFFETNEWNNASFMLVGNVKSVQTFRKVLKENIEGKISFQGYWLEGKKGL